MQIDNKLVFSGFVIVFFAVLMFASTMFLNNREYARMAAEQQAIDKIASATATITEPAATLSVPTESDSTMTMVQGEATNRSSEVRCDEAAKQRIEQNYTNMIAEENKRLQQRMQNLLSSLKETGPFAVTKRNEELKILQQESKDRLSQLLETHTTELAALNCSP